ncbi:MAG: M20 family metallopeptidase, partial [Spirochaetaceae bacterium]|nr:M20 family metallopeptidase [Spirochaetaceae bacterium]
MDAREIRAAAESIREWIIDRRRAFHMNPELGLEEVETADAIESCLEALGIERTRRGTAVVGIVRGSRPGGTVALRADIDALPIKEERDVPYRSRREGVMHACGHDGHAAILLGAARILAERRTALSGNVKLFFQPAEETEGGAQTMVREGCLEEPRVDAVFGLHLMPYLPVGKVEVKKGALNGASTKLKITIRGKGGHGAYPESGIDAVLIASNVVIALNVLVSRYVSPLEQAVITVGTIAGGASANI